MARKRGQNEGSIYQRKDGHWRVQVTIQGKRISYSAKTRQECMQWLKRTQQQIDAGLTFNGAQQTLVDYLQGWLVTIQSSIRPTTWTLYHSCVNYHIVPALGKSKLKDLSPDIIQRFYEAELKAGTGKRTVELLYSVLHRALSLAVKRGVISRNPTEATTPPRHDQKEMQFLDETQASQFLLAVRGDRNETLYYLAIATGMRQSELLGLKWSDVDWEKRTMIVQRQAKRYNRDAGYFSPLKTRLGRRIIVLGEKTTNKLHEHLIQQATEIHQAGDKWNNLDLIFPSTSGTPQDQFNLYHSFKALLKQAGLPAVRFHDLRHTAASLMLNHGVPVLVVSRRLGHSKVSITLDIYGHLIPEMQNEAAEMIDEIINPVEIKLDDNLVSENIAQYTLANI